MLTWLQFQGQRSEFDEFGRRVDDLSGQQFVSIEAAALSDPQRLSRLEIAHKNHHTLGQKGHSGLGPGPLHRLVPLGLPRGILFRHRGLVPHHARRASAPANL